jgi:hypothetical protein
LIINGFVLHAAMIARNEDYLLKTDSFSLDVTAHSALNQGVRGTFSVICKKCLK